MAEPDLLTLAYLAAHPAEAAAVLETLPLDVSVALLGEVPARIGAPVLGAMRPPLAARHLMALEAGPAAALLAGTPVQAAAALLRHVPARQRSAFLDGLPVARAVACRLLLGYPEDAVGAWAETEVVVLESGTRVGDALGRLREAAPSATDVAFVVGPAGRLVGVAGTGALLQAPADLALGRVAAPPPATLPAVMPLAAAATVPAWQRSAALPVVGSDGRVVGLLRRGTLSQVLAQREVRTAGPSRPDLASAVGGACWSAVASLVAALVALLPPLRSGGSTPS